MVVFAIPHVTWRELRQANVPDLHFLMDHGAIGLMPVAEPNGGECYRTWVTLGAGRSAVAGAIVGGPQSDVVRFEVDTAQLSRANEAAKTHADPGALGEALKDYGLRSAGSFAEGRPQTATILMDDMGVLHAPWATPGPPPLL